MTNVLTVSLLLVILLPFYILTTFIPYWTRKTESFGVSIPEDVYHDPKIKLLRKSYTYRIIIVNIVHMLALVLLFLMMNLNEQTLVIYYTVSIFIYILVSFLIYLTFHKQMKQLKQDEGWFQERKQQTFIHMKFRNQKLTVSHYLFILPFVISLITISWTLVNYELFPNKIPMNYSLTGEVTNWAEKSYRTVLFLPITQIVLTIIFIAVNIVISQAKQQVSPTNPEESLLRNVIFRRRWSLFLFWMNIALTLMFTIAQMSLVYRIPSSLLMVVFVATILGIIVGSLILSLTTGQGGSRIKLSSSTRQDVIDRDDDEHWKLGQFYFNKDDPTLFIEKRFGIGWTINFARPLAWVCILSVIGIAVLIPLLLSL